MKTVMPTELRGNIFKLLDEVLSTGIPSEINKGGKKLRIVPVGKSDRFENIISRPNVIQGHRNDLADIHWKKDVKLDLP